MAAAKETPRKRGRPTKAEQALQAKRERRAERERVEAILEDLPPVFKCTRCGKVTSTGTGNFFAIINNAAFEGNEGRASICCDCTNKFFNEYCDTYDDEKLALMLTCMHLGVYFSEALYDSMHEKELTDPENEKFTIGKYIRQLSGPQYKKQTFVSYMISVLKRKQAFSTKEESRDRLEDNWKTADKRTKTMVIREVGYDCFDDPVYSSDDRKQMFNSLSQYLISGDLSDDKHKRDAAINIVKTQMQVDFLDRELNRESRSPEPDFGKIDRLIATKKQLSEIINRTAKENAISAGGASKRNRSATAVTAIMKEMIDNGVIEAKVNLTDVKMTETFSTIAQISAKALVDEMNITGDEYAVMVGQQAETIRNQNDRIMELEEQLRLKTIQLHDYESKKKRYVSHPVELEIGGAIKLLEEEEAETEEEYIPEFVGLRERGDGG